MPGATVTLSCKVTASETGSVQWFKETSDIPLSSDDNSYLIQKFPPSSEHPLVSIAELNILNFDSENVGRYHCIADYVEPILEERSVDILLSTLGSQDQLLHGNHTINLLLAYNLCL